MEIEKCFWLHLLSRKDRSAVIDVIMQFVCTPARACMHVCCLFVFCPSVRPFQTIGQYLRNSIRTLHYWTFQSCTI